MDLKTFFEHFDTLAEAPNGIQRLRELILDMGVRGKLVPQDPADEPAYNLLKLQNINQPDPDPEEVPESWVWARFDQFLGIRGGSQPPKSTFSSIPEDGYIRLPQIRDFGEKPVPVYIPKDRAKRTCDETDVMLARYGASIGKVFMGQEGAYNVALTKILFDKNKFFNRYIFYLLKSSLFQKHLVDASRSAQAGFNKGDLQKVFLPVAPLAEQKRIVAKVDELMALCDTLEAAQQTRNTLRQSLRASALDALMNATSDRELATAWAFVRDHWGTMSDRAEDVEGLRAIIQHVALRGHLTSQLQSDTSIQSVFPRIKKEKEELIKAGKLKKPKKYSDIDISGLPKIPKSWVYCRLQDLATFGPRNGYSPKGVEYPTEVRSITLTATTSGKFDGNHFKYIDEPIEPDSHLWLQPGDILLQRSNTLAYVGTAAVYDQEPNKYIYPDLIMRIRVASVIEPHFIHLVLNSRDSRKYFQESASGTSGTMPKINQSIVNGSVVPLPPPAEQKRIVAKVDELMNLCDQLEESLRQQQQQAEALVASAISHLAA